MLLQELVGLDQKAVCRRTEDFLEYHSDEDDYAILAEAEVGTFRMGSESFYPEERPVLEVHVDGRIDPYAVTNSSTPSSSPPPGPGSMVFQKTAGPVDLTNSANW